MSSPLISTPTRVEAPFIIVTIGKYTFGNCSGFSNPTKSSVIKVTYPNYMDSLNIIKINGAVNTYTLKMTYAITQFDDPNLFEKIFSSVSDTREIKLSYGDWNAPSFIYKEETAIITKVMSQVNMETSTITYTVSCTSTALSLSAGVQSFGMRFAKPSDVLIELLKNESMGLTSVFTGMRNITKASLNNLIARDDKVVKIEAKTSTNMLEYINYLVSCMVSVTDSGGPLKDAQYYWTVFDDINNEYGGTYFKVQKVKANAKYNVSYSTYEVDVGYPNGNYVTNFSLNNDNTWSVLYDHANSIKLPQYSYSIGKSGEIITTYSPTMVRAIVQFKPIL